jgi:hypothetical protein
MSQRSDLTAVEPAEEEVLRLRERVAALEAERDEARAQLAELQHAYGRTTAMLDEIAVAVHGRQQPCEVPGVGWDWATLAVKVEALNEALERSRNYSKHVGDDLRRTIAERDEALAEVAAFQGRPEGAVLIGGGPSWVYRFQTSRWTCDLTERIRLAVWRRWVRRTIGAGPDKLDVMECGWEAMYRPGSEPWDQWDHDMYAEGSSSTMRGGMRDALAEAIRRGWLPESESNGGKHAR